jgi:PAS domain S-box-containing protein
MTPSDLSGIIYVLRDPTLLVELQGTVVAANWGASRLFQQPSPELVGKPLSALVTDQPETLSRYLRQCLQNSEGIQRTLSIRPSNERSITCSLRGGLVHQRKEEQPQLVWLRIVPAESANSQSAGSNEHPQLMTIENHARQQYEQRWRTAFENSTIGIMMADFNGRLFAANKAYRNMLGYSESELFQLTFLDITYEEDQAFNLKLVRELLDGKRQHFQLEKRYRRKDGSLLWVRTNVAIVPGMGDVAPFWINIVEDITERKRVEEELTLQIARLRETETRLQTFFGNSPTVIFLKDRQGRYLYVNNQFKRVLCITEEQIKGKRDDEVFSAEQAAAFQANDRQVLEAGVAMEFEEVARQEDGLHTSIVQKFPLFNAEGEICAIGGIVTDITQRKRAERELLAVRDELTAELTEMTRLHEFSAHLLAISEFEPLLEEVLEATIALQNADFGNIQVYNPGTQALEIVAQRGFQQDFLEYFRSVRDIGAACGRAMELRQRVIIEDVEIDSEFALHRHIAASAGFRAVQSTPLFSRSGQFLGMLSTHFRRPHRPSLRDLRFTDLYAIYAAEIIERERLEAARRKVEQVLHMTQAELARVSRLTTLGELAASIAHEVNQPLTAVTNNSNACLRLLDEHNLKPDVLRRALEEIVADGTRASAVIARIRGFIKKVPAEKNELDINEVIHEVLALTGHEFRENRVLLEHKLTPDLPRVLADRVQLQQVLLNLIMNGVEAMTAVANRPRLLCVESRVDEPAKVLVAVRDSGIGLGLEADRVFTPFFTTKANGMGMGLCISRSLIEGHGGRLWVEPNFPHGAVFYFTLPVADRSRLEIAGHQVFN